MAKLFLETIVVMVLMTAVAVVYFMISDDFMDLNAMQEGQSPSRSPGEGRSKKPSSLPTEEKALPVIKEKPVVDEEQSLSHGGLERRYLVHLPRGYDGSKPLPVVLGFHGGGGRGESFQRQTRFNDVADRQGFIMVYPNGTGYARLLTFNAGTCCGYAVRENIDDVGFVRAMVADLKKRYKVDNRRIYATGISNGAMFCYRLACEAPDLIAAIGPVSGTMGVGGPTPSRPVPLIHIHGQKDPNCPYKGGIGPKAITKIDHRSVAETIAWWVKANRCDPKPSESKEPDFVKEAYTPANPEDGAPVVLYSLPEGGHTWPGGIDLTPRLGTGPLIESVDASTILWKFFEKQRLPAPVTTPEK